MVLNIQPNCEEYAFERWIAPTEDIRVFAIYLNPISDNYVLETWLAQSDEIRVLEVKMQPICAENGFETWLIPSNETGVLALDVEADIGSKHDLRQLKEFELRHTTYSFLCWICPPNRLFSGNMATRQDSSQLLKFVYWLPTCSHSVISKDS